MSPTAIRYAPGGLYKSLPTPVTNRPNLYFSQLDPSPSRTQPYQQGHARRIRRVNAFFFFAIFLSTFPTFSPYILEYVAFLLSPGISLNSKVNLCRLPISIFSYSHHPLAFPRCPAGLSGPLYSIWVSIFNLTVSYRTLPQ